MSMSRPSTMTYNYHALQCAIQRGAKLRWQTVVKCYRGCRIDIDKDDIESYVYQHGRNIIGAPTIREERVSALRKLRKENKA